MTNHALSILEAVENLSAIVDAPSLHDIELTPENRFILHPPEAEELEESNIWVDIQTNHETLEAVAETFRSIRTHLETTYKKMQKASKPRSLIAGLSSVMVLVGEAADRLDQAGLFNRSIFQMPEYLDLQDFYKKKIIKESFKPITQRVPKKLSPEESFECTSGHHLLNDLTILKDDSLYELFYIKNEAGYDFFTPCLARNIKLACDFSSFLHSYHGDDPLLQIPNWQDYKFYLLAKKMVQDSQVRLEKFFKDARLFKHEPIIDGAIQAVTALMMASCSKNLIRQFAKKSCQAYFKDFLGFVRHLVHHKDYQKLQLYAKSEAKPVYHQLLKLVEIWIKDLYESKSFSHELEEFISKFKGAYHVTSFCDSLSRTSEYLHQLEKAHPSGPILKALDIVRNLDDSRIFDPLVLDNLCDVPIHLIGREKAIALMRLPCPTSQHTINKAEVLEEFKDYLKTLSTPLLCINFQDKNLWHDYSRCEALENLALKAPFDHHFILVTLPSQTDFIKQIGVYEAIDSAAQFMSEWKHLLDSPTSGYFFSPSIATSIKGSFATNLLEAIHAHYFQSRPQLSQQDRQFFISLMHSWLILKAVELTHTAHLAICSKDGLDKVAVEMIKLLSLLTIDQDPKQLCRLSGLMFSPTLLHRERCIKSDYLSGVINQLKWQESGSAFKPHKLFDKATLNLKPNI
jgi:hypothetical protein